VRKMVNDPDTIEGDFNLNENQWSKNSEVRRAFKDNKYVI